MITFRPEGIYCEQADVYIDPWKPVKKAVITHAHSDHARPGMGSYLCHVMSESVMRWRLGEDIKVETLLYGEEVNINGVKISFHPSGHIIGAAQVRLEYKGEVWVISGDYKLHHDGVSAPFEPVRCNSFVTESTFGLPIYNFKPCEEVYFDINEWCAQNALEGYNSVIIGYSLGKSQNILAHLDTPEENIFLHGAVYNINQALALSGLHFKGQRLTTETKKENLKNAVIVAPNSVLGMPWLRKLQPYRIAVCSGWMALRGTRRRYGVDKGFALSDHCDFAQLNEAVLGTGAENIYVTHGYQTLYSKWLRQNYGLNAVEVETLFDNPSETEPEEAI